MFNLKKIKYNKFCYRCDKYYEGAYCECKLYDVYNKSICMKHVITQLIPINKIIFILTQLLDECKIIHLDKYIMRLIELSCNKRNFVMLLSVLLAIV